MEKIELGGLVYVPVKNSTIEHDFYLMGQIRAVGLDEVHVRPDERPEDFALRLLRDVINSGRVFLLLGGLLISEGTASEDWTPELAEKTAQTLKKLTAPDDKEKVREQVLSLLIGFFETGLACLTTSRSFSPGPGRPGSGSGGQGTTETGATS
jgi:hypothetical protein